MRDDIEILSEYQGKHSDITCRCKKHPNYSFTVKATNLASGKCKICSFESKHLEGKTFGRLTVLGLDEELSLKKRNAYWRCKCICETEVYLGSYVNFEDAVRARKRAEETMFGDYSYDNSQSQGEEYSL